MSNASHRTEIRAVSVGPWTIVYNSIRAKATNTKNESSVTGMYSPKSGFRWSSPEPPEYVKTRALQAVRAQRRRSGAPV